jgi:alanyl-tRNA synthetase
MSSRAPQEPDTRNFETTVATRDGRAVVLAETYFYPEGGGQPADRGSIAGVPVVDVRKRDGRVVHALAEDADASAVVEGSTVDCAVDDAFRTYCMRAHTASHVLYGAGRRLFDDLGYGGFGIGAPSRAQRADGVAASAAGKVRVDFSTPTDVDDRALVELERLVNRAVWESRPVSWATYPKREALALDGVAFNTKTEEGLDAESVRVVAVGPPGEVVDGDRVDGDRVVPRADAREGVGPAGNWDVAACGGTHVDDTREIGPVTVLGRSNPGEGLTRVEFAVGERGIERRSEEKRVALDAARALGTGLEDVPDAVDRLRSDRDELAADLAGRRDDLVDARIDDLRESVVERRGGRWLVGTVGELDANGLADRAGSLVGDDADVVALVNDGSLAVATTGDPEADAVVGEVTDAFGGGGGGSPTVAQGGGIGADDEAVVAFLRGE